MTITADGRKVFRNNNQELENILSLEQFFRDKESVYLQECERCVDEQLQYNLQAALDYRDRDEYYRVLALIGNHQGSDKRKGLYGWLKSRYGWMILPRLKNHVIKCFKKQICKRS